MRIEAVTDSISIYSDGQRLQVIHNLGDEFILDLVAEKGTVYDLDNIAYMETVEIHPLFKVSGFCSKCKEDLYRLKWAIRQAEEFNQYIEDYHLDLVDWWKNPEKGGKQ